MNIDKLHQLYLAYPTISTDTRSIKNNSLFFALRGNNFDANKFANQALEKGAKYAIIDNKKYKLDKRYILVDNTLETLQKLATYHRDYLKIPIISLTGSNGKTTTKELINTVLQKKYTTVATKGNLNNHIGVPSTLLAMNKDTEIGIVEFGANHQNEIAFLSNIAKPNFGLITNFGKAHLEGFGSFEGVIKTKTELYNYLKDTNGTVFVNANDTLQVEKSHNLKRITFGSNKADYIVRLLEANPFVSIAFNDEIITSKMIGAYNYTNIAFAVTIGSYFNVALPGIKHAIANYTPSNNRSQIIEKESNTILLDAYNANPSSMKVALDNFVKLPKKNKIVFLGDMFELGKFAKNEHQNIVDYLETSSINNIFLVGHNFFATNVSSNKIKKYIDLKHLVANQNISEINNATIIIKGSRGMQLERLLDYL